MTDADLYFDGELAALRRAKPICEVCKSANDVRMAPIMTGVPFSAPRDEQRFVCSACIHAWYECGATTTEQILAFRGVAA